MMENYVVNATKFLFLFFARNCVL